MEKSKKVNVDMEKYKDAMKKAAPWWILFNPLMGGAFYAGWLLVDLLRGQGKITEDDAQSVAEIIKAGAESDVDEMTITVNRENVLGIDTKLKGLKTKRGFNFVVGMRGDTTYEIKVKYKE